jgi:class 3 adenylate cyclase
MSAGPTAGPRSTPSHDRPGSYTSRLTELLLRLGSAAHRPHDSEDERLRKSILVLTSIFITLLTPIWFVGYTLLGRPLAAAIPLTYAVVTVASLVHLWRTKHYDFFRFSQLAMMLVLPFAFQWALGGFLNGSAVSLWAFVSALGALIFYRPRVGAWWFAAFTALLVISAAIDPSLARAVPPFPESLRAAFLAINLASVTLVTYVALQYFVRGRERATEALVQAHRRLQAEQDKSERLLTNVLPVPIAERLKEGEEVIADAHPDVTVLFADVVDFTPLAERTTPDNLVRFLDDVFSRFDELAERFGLEKIKTIGDAYMAVAGLPDPRPDHADAAANMALAICDALAVMTGPSRGSVQARVGLNSGPVVAGVIGRKKFIYDLWGDTVNTASRMESHGIPGRIQVTEATYQLLRGRYAFEERGPIEVKGKGQLRTYLLIAAGPAANRAPIREGAPSSTR